ncbi:MAG: hypothetical protein ACKO7P_15625 [Bacteroidota bacterium]
MSYTNQQYIALWNQYVGSHTALPMPPYQDYLDRENFFQDYLDIFRGQDTRAARGLAGPHPFGVYLLLVPPPAINYILIGEAAHHQSPTFFYNPNHLDNTLWLSAPLGAFNIAGGNPRTFQDKIIALYTLAANGFLLLDLYPFAIEYGGGLRKNLNYIPFWNHLMWSITVDFHYLINQGCILALSGPANTHHQIATQLHNQTLFGTPPYLMHPQNCTLTWGENYVTNALSPAGVIVPPTNQNQNLLNLQIPGAHRLYLDERFQINPNNFNSPIYRCETWDASFQGPNSLFIKVAFGLP